MNLSVHRVLSPMKGLLIGLIFAIQGLSAYFLAQHSYHYSFVTGATMME